MTFKNTKDFVLTERKPRCTSRPKTQEEWNVFVEHYMTHTLKETAEQYDCSVPTVRNWMKIIRKESE